MGVSKMRADSGCHDNLIILILDNALPVNRHQLLS